MSTPALYRQALGPQWDRLPAPIRALHDAGPHAQFAGESSVERGRTLLARLCAGLMGFPPAAAVTPVRVLIEHTAAGERWIRQFGRHRFQSELSLPRDRESGVLMERFGPLRFRLRLPADDQGLRMPLLCGSCLGLPLPRWLTPVSDTREYVDGQGRFCFDVSVSLPLAGLVVRYRGWLLRLA